MDLKSISGLDKLILLNALGYTSCPKDKVDAVIKEAIKSYSINYTTGEIAITYKKPLEVVTVSVDLK